MLISVTVVTPVSISRPKETLRHHQPARPQATDSKGIIATSAAQELPPTRYSPRLSWPRTTTARSTTRPIAVAAA
ncbi:hypothetical protein CR970_02570 [Candidatus Saccharibacteria bacterium]|nr:MAG: hypothetical protein CR970_02570 [Candidatus Saccharibacteria bacterium]